MLGEVQAITTKKIEMHIFLAVVKSDPLFFMPAVQEYCSRHPAVERLRPEKMAMALFLFIVIVLALVLAGVFSSSCGEQPVTAQAGGLSPSLAS